MLIAAFVGHGGSYAIIVDWLEAAQGPQGAAIKVGLVPYSPGAAAVPLCLSRISIAPLQDFASFKTAWLTVLLLCIAPSNAMSNTIVQLIAPPGAALADVSAGNSVGQRVWASRSVRRWSAG